MFIHKSQEKKGPLINVCRRFVICSVIKSVIIGPTMWEFGISKPLLTNHMNRSIFSEGASY